MRFRCYTQSERAPKIVAAGIKRDWMDDTIKRSAYRCTPMTIANSGGWEILLPFSFVAHWNGGPHRDDLRIELPDGRHDADHFVSSHFGNGVLTFVTGYLFQTEPGWTVSARGAPNWPKDGIMPLEGTMETDWLPFPFAMNWIFTRPGSVSFTQGEPFCFITLVPPFDLESIIPEIRPLKSNPALYAEYDAWRRSRKKFNAGIFRSDPATLKQGWQRNYVDGKTMLGSPASSYHKIKRRVADPVVVNEDYSSANDSSPQIGDPIKPKP